MASITDKKLSLSNKKEFLFSVVLLFLFWLIISLPTDIHSPLWWKNLIQHLVVGLILAVGVSWLMRRPLFTAEEIAGFSLANLMRFLAYLVYLMYQIVIAGIDVARRVLRWRLLIQPHLVEFHTPLRDEIPLVINANSITLTPGTITVDVEQEATGSRFLVHCISEQAAQHISQSRGFVKEILRIYGQEEGNG